MPTTKSTTLKAPVKRAAKPAAKRTTRAKKAAVAPVVPRQRRSEVDELGLRTDELVVAEHEAQDAKLLALLDD